MARPSETREMHQLKRESKMRGENKFHMKERDRMKYTHPLLSFPSSNSHLLWGLLISLSSHLTVSVILSNLSIFILITHIHTHTHTEHRETVRQENTWGFTSFSNCPYSLLHLFFLPPTACFLHYLP